jgi:hypothetical protein
MHCLEFNLLRSKSFRPAIPDAPSRLARLGTRISVIGILSCLCFVVAGLCHASSEHVRSRSFDGVTAAFEIKDFVIRIGEDLKVVAVYRNTGHRTVNFHFFQADQDTELYPKGKSKQLVNVFVGEPHYSDVILKPGESARFEETFNLKGWPDLVPGDYEIRFFYHLGLLFDDSLAKRYRKKYHVEHNVVPWEDRRHAFTITK